MDFNVANSQDWKVSCGPHDFGEFVLSIRQVEELLGERTKTVQVCEDAALHWALKSLVAVKDLPAGTVLSVEHLSSKRPGDGLSPAHLDEVLGQKLRHSVRRDQPITLNNLL